MRKANKLLDIKFKSEVLLDYTLSIEEGTYSLSNHIIMPETLSFTSLSKL
ncbi:unnamed protein product [Moneuplotes crassus]|uniref:Uncharacterized protein n=1 Tax=Euplotes crassus TaxID=5936 RepID=A0AAD2D6S2_EUPCR|nr:unnamed protein product [Moneuplotes crassus]